MKKAIVGEKQLTEIERLLNWYDVGTHNEELDQQEHIRDFADTAESILRTILKERVMFGYASGEASLPDASNAYDLIMQEADANGMPDVLVGDDVLMSIPATRCAWVWESFEKVAYYGGEVKEIVYTRVLAKDRDTPRGYLVERSEA